MARQNPFVMASIASVFFAIAVRDSSGQSIGSAKILPSNRRVLLTDFSRRPEASL